MTQDTINCASVQMGYLCTFLHSLRAGLEASDETGEATVHVSSVGQKLGVNQPRVHRVARDTSSWHRQSVMCAICTCIQLAIMLNHAFTKYSAVEVMTWDLCCRTHLILIKMWFTFHPFRQLQVEQDVGEFALRVDGCAFVVSLEHDVVPLHVSLALKKKTHELLSWCCWQRYHWKESHARLAQTPVKHSPERTIWWADDDRLMTLLPGAAATTWSISRWVSRYGPEEWVKVWKLKN